MSELLPCPFCNSENRNVQTFGTSRVICPDCGAQGPVAGTKKWAIVVWNTRATGWMPLPPALEATK